MARQRECLRRNRSGRNLTLRPTGGLHLVTVDEDDALDDLNVIRERAGLDANGEIQDEDQNPGY